MDILIALGVNQTLFIQFGIFFFCYLVISNLLFKPFSQAFAKREQLTVGQSNAASDLWKQVEALQLQFETEARELNEKVRSIYDQQKLEGQRTYNAVVEQARIEAKQLIENSRKMLKQQVEAISPELEQEVAQMSDLIRGHLVDQSSEAS